MVVGLAIAVMAAVAFVALMPRSSGDGWRLDRAAAWEEPLPDELDPSVVVYGSDARSVGFGVTVYGDPSCPPELRGAGIGEDDIRVVIADRRPIGYWLGLSYCNLGARPYQFGILVERDRLPDTPFDVVVFQDERPPETFAIESLP
jgi:hypothetical protein